MSMEMSTEMYDRLVGLITDARIAAVNCQIEVKLLREERDRDYAEVKKTLIVLTESFSAAEQDLGKVQSELRKVSTALESQATEIGKMAQSVDGITQLTMSNYDQLESFRRHVYGESSDQDGEKATGTPQ